MTVKKISLVDSGECDLPQLQGGLGWNNKHIIWDVWSKMNVHEAEEGGVQNGAMVIACVW